MKLLARVRVFFFILPFTGLLGSERTFASDDNRKFPFISIGLNGSYPGYIMIRHENIYQKNYSYGISLSGTFEQLKLEVNVNYSTKHFYWDRGVTNGSFRSDYKIDYINSLFLVHIRINESERNRVYSTLGIGYNDPQSYRSTFMQTGVVQTRKHTIKEGGYSFRTGVAYDAKVSKHFTIVTALYLETMFLHSKSASEHHYHMVHQGWPGGDYHTLIGLSLGIAFDFPSGGKLSQWMQKQEPLDQQ